MRRPALFAGVFCCVLTGASCQEATLSGGNGKKKNSSDASEIEPPNGVDQKGVRTPDIDDFDDTGWVPDDLIEEFAEYFKKPGDPETGTTGDGSGSEDTPFGSDENVFWMGCDEEARASNSKYTLEGPKGLKVRLSGEFCPSRPVNDKLTVLFVVDFSGSMHGSNIEGPNDPTTGNSCGRLKAAEALVAGYSGSEFKGIDVDVGMIGFSNSASTRINFTAAKVVKSQLNAGTWCGSDSTVARTNYQAAFSQAEQALSSIDGEKIVFFISDGSPTVGGIDPESAGRGAAESLRNNIKDLTLNVIFVGYQNGEAKNPQGYLESVAGDKDKVTLVASADQLVDAVQSIGAGKIKIKKADVEAMLSAAGGDTPLKLEHFQKSPKGLNSYVFATEVFQLSGEKGKVVENAVRVKATTSEPKEIEAEAVISFRER